jgi:hypothetical protein
VVVVVWKGVEVAIKLDNIPNLPTVNPPGLRHATIVN